MEEILHQLIGSFSQFLQGFYIPGGFLPDFWTINSREHFLHPFMDVPTWIRGPPDVGLGGLPGSMVNWRVAAQGAWHCRGAYHFFFVIFIFHELWLGVIVNTG